MIRTIMFDLDNTLLDFSWAEKIALEKTLRSFGIEPEPEVTERYRVLNRQQWELLEKGELTREEVKVRRFRLLFEEMRAGALPEKVKAGVLPREAAAVYERLLGVGHRFIDGAEELLEELYGKYDLYLVTNGTASVQNSRLDSAGMRRYFKGIFISEEIGADKPGKEYFDRCFAQMPDFKKEEALLVGDSLTADIKGGENTGIKTVWFNPQGLDNHTGIVPDHEIRRLSQIKGLLR